MSSSASSPSNSPAPVPEQAPRPGRQGGGSRWRLPLVLVAVLAAGIVAYQFWLRPVVADQAAPATVTVRTGEVVSGTFEKVIRLGGITSSVVFTNVRAPRQRGPDSGALILLELVPSGTMVKKGDVVALIDGQGLKDHIDDVQSTVNTSVADIKKRKAEQEVDWNNLEQNLRVSESNWEKWKLEAQAAEVRTVIDRELLKLGVEEAKSAYEREQRDLDYKEDVHEAELEILELTTERHKRHLGRHASDLERYTVEAPMDGMAVRQSIFRSGEFDMVEVGDRLWPGLLFMKVMDTGNMQVEAKVNQADSHLFRVGMEARIGLDAFEDLTFPGHVYSIGALAKSSNESEYVREIPLQVKIEGSHSKLLPDLSAYADVVIEKREDVRQVPLEAVMPEEGQDYVFVKKGSGFEKRPVELGDRNFTHAAVVSGLDAGEIVALEAPAS